MSTTHLVRLDLAAELDRMRLPHMPAPPHHLAKTLVRSSDLRVVLISLEAGAELAEHAADAAITLQILDGRVELASDGCVLELSPGTMTTLERGARHALRALERSSVLLSIAWTGHHAPAEAS